MSGNRRGGPTVKEVLDATYTHNAANQMEQGRKYSYDYDDFGNQSHRYLNAAKTKYWQYSWTVENRLQQAQLIKDGQTLRTLNFKYDAFGRRIEKQVIDTLATTTTSYVYDGEDIVLQLVDDGATVNTRQYLHGPGIDEPLAQTQDGLSFYYHADGLGSILALTDSGKSIVQRYQYDTFGTLTAIQDAEFGNAYTYTGREWDRELGLYYYRARYYDPMEGRFISKDPIGFAGGDVNLYGYVWNRPILITDPSGLIWVTIDIEWHHTHNIVRGVLNRVTTIIGGGDDPSVAGASPDEWVGLKRTVIQEWQCDPNNPSRNDEYPIGTRRHIDQEAKKFISAGPGRDLLNDPDSDLYYRWDPRVESPTYKRYPGARTHL